MPVSSGARLLSPPAATNARSAGAPPPPNAALQAGDREAAVGRKMAECLPGVILACYLTLGRLSFTIASSPVEDGSLPHLGSLVILQKVVLRAGWLWIEPGPAELL